MGYDPKNPLKDRITDIGPRYYEDFFPPIIKENHGKWLYHEILEPGVLVHVSETGAKCYTVRVGGSSDNLPLVGNFTIPSDLLYNSANNTSTMENRSHFSLHQTGSQKISSIAFHMGKFQNIVIFGLLCLIYPIFFKVTALKRKNN